MGAVFNHIARAARTGLSFGGFQVDTAGGGEAGHVQNTTGKARFSLLQLVGDSATPASTARAFVDLSFHEAAHGKETGHGPDFKAEEARLKGLFGPDRIASFEQKVAKALAPSFDSLKQMAEEAKGAGAADVYTPFQSDETGRWGIGRYGAGEPHLGEFGSEQEAWKAIDDLEMQRHDSAIRLSERTPSGEPVRRTREETLAAASARARVGDQPEVGKVAPEEAVREGETETSGKPPDLPFNLDRMAADDDFKRSFSSTFNANKGKVADAQGKVTLKDVQHGALRLLGITNEAQLKHAADAGMLSNKEALQAVRITLAEAMDAKGKAKAAWDQVRGKGGAVEEEAQDAYTAASLKAANWMLTAKGAQAEAARALGAYRILVAPRSEAEFLVSKLLKTKGGLSPEQTAKILDAADNHPEKLADTVQQILHVGKGMKLMELWKAGLLSGPPTHGANTVGNLLKQGLTLGETAFTAHVTEPIVAKLQNRPVERFSGEAGTSWAAVRSVGPEAMRTLVGQLKEIATLQPEKINLQGGPVEHQVGAIGGKFGRFVRTPFRLLGAADDFFKTLAGEQELYKQALREAHSAPKIPGVDITDIAQKRIDAYKANPDSPRNSAMKRAVEAARLRETFQDAGDQSRPINALIPILKHAAKKVPFLDVMFPFKQVPARIADVTLEHTPYGFKYAFDAYKDYKAGKISGGELSDAITKPVIGTAVMGTVMAAAQAGLMTGAGPVDNKEKALLKQTGWQPYSFVFPGEDGKSVYVPFNRFEPVSSLLGMAADFYEAGHEKSDLDMLSKIGGSVLENMANKTYLAGLEGVAGALNDPKRYARQYVTGLAGTLVPNIVAKAAQGLDENVRETKGDTSGLEGLPQSVARTIESRIPGLSQTLPERLDAAGQEVKRPGSMATRFLSPSVPSETKPENELQGEMSRVGYTGSSPSRTATVKGKKVQLNDAEYQKLQDAYDRAFTYAQRLIKSPTYKNAPDTPDEGSNNKKKMLEQLYERFVAPVRTRLAQSAYRRAL